MARRRSNSRELRRGSSRCAPPSTSRCRTGAKAERKRAISAASRRRDAGALQAGQTSPPCHARGSGHPDCRLRPVEFYDGWWRLLAAVIAGSPPPPCRSPVERRASFQTPYAWSPSPAASRQGRMKASTIAGRLSSPAKRGRGPSEGRWCGPRKASNQSIRSQPAVDPRFRGGDKLPPARGNGVERLTPT
jgi:hypothetical protein